MSIKTFTIKSNARRAARAAGLDLSTLEFVQGADSNWYWTPAALLAVDAPTASVPPAEVNRAPVVSPDAGEAWRALYEGPAPAAEPVEDADEAPKAAAVSVPRRGKSAALVAEASSETGITNARIREVTGWTKFGGFFDAVKRAGLQLRRVREGGDTRWFAEAPAEAAQANA